MHPTTATNRLLTRAFLIALLPTLLLVSHLAAAPLSKDEAIKLAHAEVAKNDTWAERAEYTAEPSKGGWSVTAWRIEHPEKEGSARLVPGGFRSIVIDSEGKVVSYLRGH